MKMSPDVRRVLDAGAFDDLSQGDLLPEFRDVVTAGWLVDDEGAVLLRDFLGSYHGDRARFNDIIGYETAVNGRGIPDFDFTSVGNDRVVQLFRRGVAFASSALHEAYASLNGRIVFGYVSVGATLMDPSDLVGTVTFCALRENERRYVEDVESMIKGMWIEVSSNECALPL